MATLASKYMADINKEVQRDNVYYDQNELDKLRSDCVIFEGMMLGYEAMYSEDRKLWKIHKDCIERWFEIDMGEFDFVGKIDLMAEVKGTKRPIVVEHKTASKIDAGYIERLPIDTQIRSYIFSSIRGLGITPSHVLYDVIRKTRKRLKKNESREEFNERLAQTYVDEYVDHFYREELRFNRGDVAAFEFELHQTHQQYMAFVRGDYGDPLDPRTWTPNDNSCYQYNSSCEFLTPCTSGLDLGTEMMYEQKSK